MDLPKLPIANTIRDQVYQLLKNEICQGVYEPGYWLQEKELSQRRWWKNTSAARPRCGRRCCS